MSRAFHLVILLACLALAGSGLIDRRDSRSAPVLVATLEGCHVWADREPAGRLSWSGGCAFTGHRAEGAGRLETIDDAGFMIERFDGEMRDGLKHGWGQEIKTRDLYIGDFKFGQRAGRGEEITGGVRYRGAFRDGRRSGSGTMTWLNRDVYAGEWRDGLPHGYGELIMGTERISGQWREGCLLSSERIVAVATPIDRCLGAVASPAIEVMDERAVEPPAPAEPQVEYGCGPADASGLFRLCKAKVER